MLTTAKKIRLTFKSASSRLTFFEYLLSINFFIPTESALLFSNFIFFWCKLLFIMLKLKIKRHPTYAVSISGQVQNPCSEGAGFERSGPLHLFFHTPLHRSEVPQHLA